MDACSGQIPFSSQRVVTSKLVQSFRKNYIVGRCRSTIDRWTSTVSCVTSYFIKIKKDFLALIRRPPRKFPIQTCTPQIPISHFVSADRVVSRVDFFEASTRKFLLDKLVLEFVKVAEKRALLGIINMPLISHNGVFLTYFVSTLRSEKNSNLIALNPV